MEMRFCIRDSRGLGESLTIRTTAEHPASQPPRDGMGFHSRHGPSRTIRYDAMAYIHTRRRRKKKKRVHSYPALSWPGSSLPIEKSSLILLAPVPLVPKRRRGPGFLAAGRAPAIEWSAGRGALLDSGVKAGPLQSPRGLC